MHIILRTKGIDSPRSPLKEYIEHRLSLALDRFRENVVRVHVRLEDVNGPRGGEDKQCRILLTLKPCVALAISAVHHDSWVAVDIASDRIQRMVAAHLGRRKTIRPAAEFTPTHY